MLDFGSRFGRHANRRLRQEKVIWLTTVDSQNAPQARPVWFHWNGENMLIFSEPNKAKVRQIARNPEVGLNLNTDEEGGDVVVLAGTALILDDAPSQNRVRAYLKKYKRGIEDLGMTVPEFKMSYITAVLVTPRSMRGFF